MILRLQRDLEAIIDEEDFKKVSEYHWWFNGRYVVREKRYGLRKDNKKHKYYLHRVIMDLEKDNKLIIDHRDKNPLNNQKSNLRACTQVENQQNSKMLRNNTSGVKGVMWWKTLGYWIAFGKYNNKRVWHKYFKKFEDAVESRKEFERQYFNAII